MLFKPVFLLLTLVRFLGTEYAVERVQAADVQLTV